MNMHVRASAHTWSHPKTSRRWCPARTCWQISMYANLWQHVDSTDERQESACRRALLHRKITYSYPKTDLPKLAKCGLSAPRCKKSLPIQSWEVALLDTCLDPTNTFPAKRRRARRRRRQARTHCTSRGTTVGGNYNSKGCWSWGQVITRRAAGAGVDQVSSGPVHLLRSTPPTHELARCEHPPPSLSLCSCLCLSA